MVNQRQTTFTRRSFLWRLMILPAASVLAACSGRTLDEILPGLNANATAATPLDDSSTTAFLPPTPACGDDDDDDLTLAQTEGPYYTPNTPQRTSFLEPGITGMPLLVTGYVLSTNCTPIPEALVDFWHCDSAGVYDNIGYKLRGHQFTDSAGSYRLETILPGIYPGRTRHIHVKVQAPNQPVLTTQLYFPNEPGNATDRIYRPQLEVMYHGTGEAAFNFVLNV